MLVESRSFKEKLKRVKRSWREEDLIIEGVVSNEEIKVKAEVQVIIIGSSRKLKDSNLNSVNQ